MYINAEEGKGGGGGGPLFGGGRGEGGGGGGGGRNIDSRQTGQMKGNDPYNASVQKGGRGGVRRRVEMSE